MGIAEGCDGHGAGIWSRWRAHLRQAGWVWTQGVGLRGRFPPLLCSGLLTCRAQVHCSRFSGLPV